MARQWYDFEVVVPSGTTAANPLVADLATPAMDLVEVRVRIPPGCNGNVGFRFGAKGGQIIPINDGQWIVGSGEMLPFRVESPVNSGAWQLTAYNTGIYDHSLYVSIAVNPPRAAEASAYPQPLAVSGS